MENIIQCLNKRGFIDAVTSQQLESFSEKSFKAYIGFDPTADSLHLGNLVGIVALGWLKRFGHDPVVLIGGATAKIGDPSGKMEERPLLDSKIIEEHAISIKSQLEKLLGNLSLVFNNDSWISSFSFIEFLRDVGKHFRLGPMLGKESVRSRLDSEEGMSFTEFSYQILQGYDFYHLFKNHQVTLQIGGSDQWGNITAGIELTRKLTGQSVYGLTFPLLTQSNGKKFGKSESGAIWLDPLKTSPYQFYQYLIRVSDDDVIQLMRMLTFIDIEEIMAFEKAIASGDFEPNSAQKRLASEVTQFVHGKEGLQKALQVSAAIRPGSESTLDLTVLEEISKDMPYSEMTKAEVLHQKYIEVSKNAGLVTSKSEAIRLIKNGGAYLNNKKISDPAFIIEEKHVIGGRYLLVSAGKKKKALIQITD